LEAAGENGVAGLELAKFDHLAQLIAMMIAFDQDKRRRLFLFQTPVPGKNQAALGARRPDQTIARQMLTVDDILS
jgi:hypothetical protein